MHTHLVGGFLGSGKTTAIVSACKHLLAQGRRVGVITNDQGKYLVDTAFFRLADVPAVQVGGGCFCCRYDELGTQLSLIHLTLQPDVVFVESVGSCANVATSVIQPLLKLQESGSAALTSFSVFADARLLHRRLLGLPMPFSEHVMYLFDQQIREAGLLVINKSDLLRPEQRDEVLCLARIHCAAPYLRLQSSLDLVDVCGWVEQIEQGQLAWLSASPDFDHDRYGDGESRLAWLDQEVTWHVQEGEGRRVVLLLIDALLGDIRRRQLPIGHLKFLVQGSDAQVKISFSTLDQADWQELLPSLNGRRVQVLINARIETDPDTLRHMARQAIDQTAARAGATCEESAVTCFRPNIEHHQ